MGVAAGPAWTNVGAGLDGAFVERRRGGARREWTPDAARAPAARVDAAAFVACSSVHRPVADPRQKFRERAVSEIVVAENGWRHRDRPRSL